MQPQFAIDQPPPPPPSYNEEEKPKVGLFAMLDGMPAHLLVIIGLALALMVPMIQGFKAAGLSGAAAEVDQAERLVELRMDEFKQKKSQEQEAKLDSSRPSSDLDNTKRMLEAQKTMLEQDMSMPFDEKQRRLSDLRSQIASIDRQIASTSSDSSGSQSGGDSAERRKWEGQYNLTGRKEALLEARVAMAGANFHLLFGWLGRLLLLVGLLVMTVQSTGLKQKVLLVVLLVVLFSALSGVNLGFRAQGNLGESSRDSEVVSPPPSNR